MAAVTLADILELAFGSDTYTPDWWLGLWDDLGEIVHADYARVEVTFALGTDNVGNATIYVASPAVETEFTCPTTTVRGWLLANGETEDASFYGSFTAPVETQDGDKITLYPTDVGFQLSA